MVSEFDGFEEDDQDKQNCKLNSIDGEEQEVPRNRYFLERFSLFKTRSNFYLVGRDKTKSFWRVLKIDRLEPSELVLYEDPIVYSWEDCCTLLLQINDANRNVGGLNFFTVCYGIVGFIKFLGPYYMLLITERKEVGDVCGHPIYAISKYRLIRIPHKSVQSEVQNHSEESRYKKLLCTIDYTDYYFSYSYDLMHNLQHNLYSNETMLTSYESTFSWNGFLTQEIRKRLENTLWIVALVHGFFKQVKLSEFGFNFSLILIARRSRLHAGTRYLKRGVNEEGQAANDVEIEQIVCGGFPYKMTSMVQNRGSVPLFWGQPNSWSNLKPEISILNVDDDYKATRLHFEELTKRYGCPIVILSLLKCCDKNTRESVLGEEFCKVVDIINTGFGKAKQLEFIGMNLDGFFQTEGASVLTLLNLVTKEVLDCTGFLTYEVLPPASIMQTFNTSKSGEFKEDLANSETSIVEDIKKSEMESRKNKNLCKLHSVKPEKIQSGVLRSNCVDCLDRTNVAQFVYGLAALGYQLHALEIIQASEVNSLDESLVNKTMEAYKEMGDVLAWQYGGSSSRCKIFSETRGEWKLAIQLKEIIITLQRYINNVCKDYSKQEAIDLFLGYLRPAADQVETLESGSDHSRNDEAPDMPPQNVISSSSQRNCFLCEGMSYKSLGSLSEFARSVVSEESVTSESDDTLENRYSSALSQALTDIEGNLWFGSVRSVFSDNQGEISDLESTTSSG